MNLRRLAQALGVVLVLAGAGALVWWFMGLPRDWRVGDRDPPNVLLIVVDTLRADHLGLYGYERPTSPQLDTLGQMSTVFDRAYSHSPWTMPSIASILTGVEPREHGIMVWADPLQQQLTTLAEEFQSHGYRTGAAISHYVLRPDYHFDQGFEVYNTAALDLGRAHETITSPHIYLLGQKLTLPKRPEPFFVMLHFFDPHAWYQPHPGFDFGSEDMDLYDGEIAYTDQHIGMLLDKMAQREQLRDTIVVVVADHGEAFRDHGHNQHTLTLYEELINIPLIIWVPGFEPRRMDQVVAETQLAPTLLALAGLPMPPQFQASPIPFDAHGFLPGDDTKVYAETYERVEKQAVVDGDWKLIHDRKRRRSELYDLSTDPSEETNLRLKQRDRYKDIRNDLREYAALPRAEAQTLEISDETQQALEALGYLSGDDGAGPVEPDPPEASVQSDPVFDPELEPE